MLIFLMHVLMKMRVTITYNQLSTEGPNIVEEAEIPFFFKLESY